jgi:hypothetical protein
MQLMQEINANTPLHQHCFTQASASILECWMEKRHKKREHWFLSSSLIKWTRKRRKNIGKRNAHSIWYNFQQSITVNGLWCTFMNSSNENRLVISTRVTPSCHCVSKTGWWSLHNKCFTDLYKPQCMTGQRLQTYNLNWIIVSWYWTNWSYLGFGRQRHEIALHCCLTV